MIRWLTATVAAIALSGTALAQCGTVHHGRAYHGHVSYATPVVAQVVKKEVIEPVYVPVAVPVYQAFVVPSYVPPQEPKAPMPQSAPSGDLQEVLSAIRGVHSKVDSIDARLRAVEAKTGGAGPAPAVNPVPNPAAAPGRQPTAADGLSVLNNKCAQCHEASNAAKGGNLTLTKGKEVAGWSDRTTVRFLKVLGRGTMPPPDSGVAALTQFEEAALFALADSAKSK